MMCHDNKLAETTAVRVYGSCVAQITSQTTKVFKVAWWMGHYGHASPKRHKAFTNNKWPAKFNLGKMHLKRFRASQNPDDKPTVRYFDKKGRPRFCGNAKLKQSQSLGLRMGTGGMPCLKHLLQK